MIPPTWSPKERLECAADVAWHLWQSVSDRPLAIQSDPPSAVRQGEVVREITWNTPAPGRRALPLRLPLAGMLPALRLAREVKTRPVSWCLIDLAEPSVIRLLARLHADWGPGICCVDRLSRRSGDHGLALEEAAAIQQKCRVRVWSGSGRRLDPFRVQAALARGCMPLQLVPEERLATLRADLPPALHGFTAAFPDTGVLRPLAVAEVEERLAAGLSLVLAGTLERDLTRAVRGGGSRMSQQPAERPDRVPFAPLWRAAWRWWGWLDKLARLPGRLHRELELRDQLADRLAHLQREVSALREQSAPCLVERLELVEQLLRDRDRASAEAAMRASLQPPSPTESRDGLSFLVPCWNHAGRLQTALQSALGCLDALPVPGEVLALDDGSLDGSAAVAEAMARRDGRVQLLASPRNLGLARARNVLLTQARFRHAFLLDADNEASPRG